MNRQIRQLAVLLLALYVVLFASLNYWQVNRTEELLAQPSNSRALLRQFNSPRGPIVTADGVVVARSIPAPEGSETAYRREYPTGELFAHLTGYHTIGLGSTQIERTHTRVLTGDTFAQRVLALENLLLGDTDYSGSVRLTVRHDLQQTARSLLGDREGSIAMLEVDTGAVTALWSYPSFDPNEITNPDYETALERLTELQQDDRDPLLANTYQQRYMPGSTFKVLTTAAALETDLISLDTAWSVEDEYTPPQASEPIRNYDGVSCGGDLTEVFRRSCNTPFARMAIDLGPDAFQDGVNEWGIGDPVPIDLPGAAASTIGDFSSIDQNLPLLAMRGFGQNDDQMVPLHMAMVAATVANDGEMMEPFVVDAELDHRGRVIDSTSPSVWRRPITRQTAETLQGLMTEVAESGTASCCIGLANGISVAAKTGTAQLNERGEPERSHAWIIAYAPADDPQYAVAVMLKGTNAEISAGTGGTLAGPIAKQMLDAAFAAVPPGSQQ